MHILRPFCFLVTSTSDNIDGKLIRGVFDMGWAPVIPICLQCRMQTNYKKLDPDEALLSLNLLRRSDSILVLEGWRRSERCRVEYAYAKEKEMKIYSEVKSMNDGTEFINKKLSNKSSEFQSLMNQLGLKVEGGAASELVEVEDGGRDPDIFTEMDT